MKYTYTVIKSNRKTYSIRITDENRIIVRTPKNATQRDIDKLLAEKKNWIEKILAFNENNNLNSADIQSYRCAYVNGTAVPVITDTRNYIDEAGVHITGVKNFKAAYVNGASKQFLSRFHEVENICNLHAKTVNFRSYKGRWGCCDGEKNIIFNFKLMMLPIALQNYVIVHELCHTVYMNHSAQFWDLVKRFLPDYAKLRKQLKNYNFLVNMY